LPQKSCYPNHIENEGRQGRIEALCRLPPFSVSWSQFF
jgi:hypothetical protein